MNRRTLLLLPLAACTPSAPPRAYEPLRYDFLTPLRLNIATIAVSEPPPPNGLDAQNPAPPGPALRQLVLDRLAAGGSAGSAQVAVVEAFIGAFDGGLDGALAVQIVLVGADGARLGNAEARVTRRMTGAGRGALPGALYDLTRLMLADMNVELEFQLRRALKTFLQEVSTAPAPAPVEQVPLDQAAPAKISDPAPEVPPPL